MKVTKTKISGPSKTFKVREADHRIFKQCSANTGLDMYELFTLALDVALKHFPEWLNGNQDSSSSNPPVPKPISPVLGAGKTTVENSRDAEVTLISLAERFDAKIDALTKLISEVVIVKTGTNAAPRKRTKSPTDTDGIVRAINKAARSPRKGREGSKSDRNTDSRGTGAA